MSPNKKQTKFSDIKNKLRRSVLRLYDIPDYGQADLFLVNMANFFPLLKSLMDSVRPRIICEIGSDQGMTSDLLYQYCRANDAQLHVVDPGLHGNKQSDDIVTFYPQMSLPYLQKAEPADMYFLDGDHNFYTVLNELQLIRDKNSESRPRFIFVHDVAWPCGYMDMYYDLNTIERQFLKENTSGLNLSVFNLPYVTAKQGLPIEEVFVATEDGGKENGVLAAVEKFLEESPGWRFFSIPSIFGLGVLWYEKGSTQEVIEEVEQLSGDFGRFKAFLSILELNRVMLLEKLQESGEIWKQQNDYINLLEEKNVAQGFEWKEQNDHIQAQNRQIEDLWSSCKALEEKREAQSRQIGDLRLSCKALEEKCETQGREWEAQRNYIDELIRRNVSLDLKVMELESPMGIIRSMIRIISRRGKKRSRNSR